MHYSAPALAERLLAQRWPYLAAALVVVSLFVASLIRLESDPRPTGGIREIETLSRRDGWNE